MNKNLRFIYSIVWNIASVCFAASNLLIYWHDFLRYCSRQFRLTVPLVICLSIRVVIFLNKALNSGASNLNLIVELISFKALTVYDISS